MEDTEMDVTINKTRMVLVQGDITEQESDVIVNAANPNLMGGGGVDGAIHRAGGPAILEECKAILSGMDSMLPTGQAVVTGGGNLMARYVIHTVGPVWHGGSEGESILLADAYRNSLILAVENGLKTIAFPSISTGAYGYPIEQAAGVALEVVVGFLKRDDFLSEIAFVLFDRRTISAYTKTLKELLEA